MKNVFFKTKKILKEYANERVGEIQTLSEQIYFHNLTYYFKGEDGLKNLIAF